MEIKVSEVNRKIRDNEERKGKTFPPSLLISFPLSLLSHTHAHFLYLSYTYTDTHANIQTHLTQSKKAVG